MSATGIGFRATAAPLASAKFQIRRLAASSRIRILCATISSVQVAGEEQRVERDEGLALAFQDVRMRSFSGSMTGAGRSHSTVVVPSGCWILTLNGSGRAAVMTTSSGRTRCRTRSSLILA